MKEQGTNVIEKVKEILTEIRADVVGNGDSTGKCIEASEKVYLALVSLGLSPKIVEGWIIYDDGSHCSDVPWDAHTWVEVIIENSHYYLDCTLDQFQHGMHDKLPSVYVGEVPAYAVYEEPVDAYE